MSPVGMQIPDHVTQEVVDRIDWDQVSKFRKVPLTAAIRMAGPFVVETSEGPLSCKDGYLCRDARGYGYPVATEEFDLIYEPAGIKLAQDVHPATAGVLAFFEWVHLPEHLQAISRPFAELAHKIAGELEGPELTVALRKLLEAKDCAVRAALPPVASEHVPPETLPEG